MLAPITVTANGTGGLLKGVVSKSLFWQVSVGAVPTGGSPTLDVWLQHSVDQGTTWRDLAHSIQFNGANNTSYFASISGFAAGSAAILAASDASIAANTVVQGPYGDQLRMRWVFVAGNSGGYVLSGYITQKI